VAVPL